MEKTILDIADEIKQKTISNTWIEATTNGYGNCGITLESLLGKERENLEIPDYKGIEIKTKYSNLEQRISLFHCIPDNDNFDINDLQQKYGYPDKNYPEFKVFNVALYANWYTKLENNNFILKVDYNKKIIYLNVYDKNNKFLNSYCSWSFDILKEKLERKLHYLVYIKADKKFSNNKYFFKYHTLNFYELISFDKFIELIKIGKIKITFSIGMYKKGPKFGQIYDHGTNFSIKYDDLEKLFKKIY